MSEELIPYDYKGYKPYQYHDLRIFTRHLQREVDNLIRYCDYAGLDIDRVYDVFKVVFK